MSLRCIEWDPTWMTFVDARDCCPSCAGLRMWAEEQRLPPAEKLLLLRYADNGRTSIRSGVAFTGLPREEVARLTRRLRARRLLPLPGDIEHYRECTKKAAKRTHGRRRKQLIPHALRWSVFKRDEFRCKDCGTQDDLSADHIVPESLGGPTTFDNLQTLCRPCNSRKGVTV